MEIDQTNVARAGFLPARVIHLHPSRFCNLACKHCYSMSGPTERGELDLAKLLAALPRLRAEGYGVVSLSGGEPLLYSGFEGLVRGATAAGFRVNLISNGAPVGGRFLDLISEHVDLIAISLDGPPDIHAEVRGDPQAFARAERAMNKLGERGVRFGISYCVSRESLEGMPWAVDFAREKGAALVQFHPFAATGRGRSLAERFSLDAPDMARAYVVSALLEEPDGPAVHIDLAPVEAARAQRGDYSILAAEQSGSLTLSDLVNPLVIDEIGRVLPLSYGMHPRFALGRLAPDLDEMIHRYKREDWKGLRDLLDFSFSQLGRNGERFVDWFYHIVEMSHLAPVSPLARC
jgi:Fe-coproporphyrin III synthase